MNAEVVEFAGVDLQRLARLATLLHQHLPPRVVIALQGTLGAGKTRFAQELAQACGVAVADVTSPTFTIVQHYHAQRRIHHIDAYRLADEDEFLELGGEEVLWGEGEGDALVLVEWPERIAAVLPPDCLRIEIEIDSPADPVVRADTPAGNAAHRDTPGAALGDTTANFGDTPGESPAEQATRTLRASSADPRLLAILRQVRQRWDAADRAAASQAAASQAGPPSSRCGIVP